MDKVFKLPNEDQLVDEVNTKFKQAVVAKADLVKDWQKYIDAYNGDYFENTSKPEYKSDAVSNYIFSTIETIRPIMLDGNPQFEVLARTPAAQAKADAVEFALMCEFDREKVKQKLSKELINVLTIGNAVFYQPFDTEEKEIKLIPVSAFNLYADPLATCVDDAEYICYASYIHANKLKKKFPKFASRIRGAGVTMSELVQDKDKQAATITNQVLAVEMWCRDWTTIECEEDGEKVTKMKYPNGRILVVDLTNGILLMDAPSPYNDGKFPFEIIKCYDIPGKFWGDGEVKRLLSPQTQMNELLNAVIDNAKATANMPWIVDKNAGIPVGKITNRPGLVIRKTPGSEVRREQPPSMPAYIQNLVIDFKSDIEQISGVHDTLKGNAEKGVYTAQGILSLQEAGQARIRLKVKNMEESLAKIANTWYNRIQQYWTEDKYVRMFNEEGKAIFILVKKGDFQDMFDIKIIASSTMQVNKGAMFDLMIRMAQTPAEDGLPMVDRKAVLQFMPGFKSKEILQRFEEYAAKQQQAQQAQAQAEQQGKANEDQVAEIQNILQELTKEVQGLNQEVAQLRGEYDQGKDEEKLSQIKDQAYNEAFNDMNKQQSTESANNEVQNQASQDGTQEIPNEILDMINQMDDAELEELLQKRPDLAELIKGQQDMNSQNMQREQAMMGTPEGGNE